MLLFYQVQFDLADLDSQTDLCYLVQEKMLKTILTNIVQSRRYSGTDIFRTVPLLQQGQDIQIRGRFVSFPKQSSPLDVEDCFKELLRQQSYAIKNQLGHPKPPIT